MWDQIWPWICLSPYGWKTVLLEKHQRPWFKSTTKPRGSHLLNVYFWMYFIALWIENNSSGKTPKVPWFKSTTKPLGSHLLNVYFWMCFIALGMGNDSSRKTQKVPWFKSTTKPSGSHLLIVYFGKGILIWQLKHKASRTVTKLKKKYPESYLNHIYISNYRVMKYSR